ncbi:hypothetical protein [Microbacterium karelineae]|uniref:hypothetical protein n=1 Tax=Microbacterium karelineae TaxID=2654283 RepID=UPI0012E9A43B|nr:hypothetical protein [Microbacterium karelineae]
MTDFDSLQMLRTRPLTDDRDLVRLVSALLGTASTARVWLLLLDDEMRSTEVLIPIDDLPADAGAVVAMPSDGPVAAAEMLGARVADIVRDAPVSAVVVVWERPGAPGARADTLAWIDAMRTAFASDPRALRAQLVLSDEGAHVIGEPARRAA